MTLRRGAWLLALLFLPWASQGHVGDPNIIYEGNAGPYTVRVIVRLPGVVPGLADINVRVLTPGATRVTVLPVYWRAGKKGAPPPDLAELVPGATNLYHAELWLMTVGSYSVYVDVEGERGTGTAIVPVNSFATSRREMPRAMSAILVGLGLLLFFAAAAIVGAAVRESVLEPGSVPNTRRRRLGAAGAVAAAIFLALALNGGWRWWTAVDREYRSNRLYKSVAVQARVQDASGQRMLTLSIKDPNWGERGWAPLIPDHGKWMHLYMVRQPDLSALAHLHPVARDVRTFECSLPSLPPGKYQLYADVTHESGLSQTLVATVELPAESAAETTPESPPEPDRDDSWHAGQSFLAVSSGLDPIPATTQTLEPGVKMIRQQAQPLFENQETTLRFAVLDDAGHPVELEPYMNMLSHAAVLRTDGSVFTHLHPAGSISVAAQQVFALRSQGKAPKIITAEALERFCKPPSQQQRFGTITFPYQFPRSGPYRIWVQVKVKGRVRTGVFDLQVASAK